MFYFARNLHDHVAAAAVNISVAGAPAFWIGAYPTIGWWRRRQRSLRSVRAGAMRALLEVNRRAVELMKLGARSGARLPWRE